MTDQERKEKLDALSKSLKKRKYFSILLALFTLGVNIFAWFAFSANAGVVVEATVASWDVDFKEGDTVFRNFLIEVNKMKPGMTDNVTEIEVENKGDVVADFDYEILSFSLLGHTINLSNITDVSTYLSDFYPFSITMVPSSSTISPSGSIDFDVTVSWDYEEANTYYALNEVYTFDDTFTYYSRSGNTYVPYSVTSSTYPSVYSNLYLEKDDADTFFGMQCAAYETTSGQPCLTLSMRLKVEQLIDNNG